MANNQSKLLKFSDLSEPVKLEVTKYLPKKVKIALVDVFQPVVTQIKSVTLQELTSNKDPLTEEDINQAVELYKKLTSVTKITNPDKWSPGNICELVDAIGSNLRPDIEECFVFDHDFDHIYNLDGLKYIELLLRRYPNFDGSDIKEPFDVPNFKLTDLLQKFPRLKLKLQLIAFGNGLSSSNIPLIQDTRLRRMITVMVFLPDDDDSFQELPSKSLESLETVVIYIRDLSSIDTLTKIRLLNPGSSIKHLRIHLQRGAITSAIDLSKCILSFERLQSLRLYYYSGYRLPLVEFNEEQVSAFYSLVTVLTTANKPSLTHLTIINDDVEWSISMSILLWNNIRNGFKFIEISNSFLNEIFILDKNFMKFINCELSFLDVHRKFPHVKRIVVETDNHAYKQVILDELEVRGINVTKVQKM